MKQADLLALLVAFLAFSACKNSPPSDVKQAYQPAPFQAATPSPDQLMRTPSSQVGQHPGEKIYGRTLLKTIIVT